MSHKNVVQRSKDLVLKSGHVSVIVHHEDGQKSVVDLGENKLTETFRVYVARFLARTAATMPGVTFMNDDGLIISDTYMPLALIVGTGTTPADKTDTALETKIGAIGAVEFPLQRVDVNDNIGKYGTGPIYVGFEFDIPSGAINGEVTPYTITEWGMIAGDGTGATLLARKVGDLIKHFNLSVTVRWEIRV